MDPGVIKTKGKEDLFDELPIEFMKVFGEVQFEEHTRILEILREWINS